MLGALTLALGDLADRRILAILVKSLLVTLLLFAAAGVGAAVLLHGVDPCEMAGFDPCPLDGAASSVGAGLLALVALWFLFPAVALGVIANYADAVADAVEARRYPTAAASARRLGMAGAAWFGLRQSLRVLLYNLLALPLYLVLIVTGIGPLILFILVNGLAVAADVAALVAMRHGDGATRRAWFARTRGERIGIGIATAALLLVPFANLLAPILAVAAMTHLYQRLPARS